MKILSPFFAMLRHANLSMRIVIAVFATGVGHAVFSTLTAFESGQVFEAIVRYDSGSSYILIAAVAACFLAADGLARLNTWFAAKCFYHVRNSLACKVFSYAQRLPILAEDGAKIGKLVSLVETDADSIGNLLSYSLLPLIQASFQVALSVMVMCALAPVLAGSAVAFLPIWLAISRMQTRKSKLLDKISTANDEKNTLCIETLGTIGIMRAKTFDAYTFDLRRFKTSLEKGTRYGLRWISWSGILSFFLNASSNLLGNALTLAVGTYLLSLHAISIGTLVAVLVIQAQLSNPAQTAVESWLRLIAASTTIERVKQILEARTEQSGSREFPIGEIKITNPVIAFDGVELFGGMDLTISAGDWIAVEGRNGTGKSVLLKLLTRMIEKGEGSVTLGGMPIEDVSLSSLRKSIVLISHEDSLFTGTLRDNLSIGKLLSDQEVFDSLAAVGLSARIAYFKDGLDHVIGPTSSDFSSGERQRIVIARALLSKPRVLILDEATSNIDEQSEISILDEIRRMLPQVTLVFVSHRLTDFRQHFRRRLLFENGTVVDQLPTQ